MIHTRKTIFKTLLKRIRELTKHADPAPKEFKKIIMAVILNDLKEWSEYIPSGESEKILSLLVDFLMNNCFIIERFNPNPLLTYVNVNTPQNNDTWSRVWDKSESNLNIDPELQEERPKSWTPDPNCKTEIVYFTSINKHGDPIENEQYLKDTYGKYGQKLTTICDKMEVFVDRETGIGWYLDTDNNWKELGSEREPGMTERQVEDLISQYHIHKEWEEDESTGSQEIKFTLKKGEYDDTIKLLTKDEVEAMI